MKKNYLGYETETNIYEKQDSLRIKDDEYLKFDNLEIMKTLEFLEGKPKPRDFTLQLDGEDVSFKEKWVEKDIRLRDPSRWSYGSVKGLDLFKDFHVRQRMNCAEFFAWQLLLEHQEKKKEIDEKLEVVVVKKSFTYFFRTVSPESLEIYESLENEGTGKVKFENKEFSYCHKIGDKRGVITVPVKEFLYEVELQKAETFIRLVNKKDYSLNDWLYSLWMYNKHKNDVERVCNLMGRVSGRLISYGDRVGAVQAASIYDIDPSAYALRPVLKADTQVLRKLCVNKLNVILLMYTYSSLSEEERQILLKANAWVIIWSETEYPEYKHAVRGVSSNRDVSMQWHPTEFVVGSTFPYSENFAMLADRVFCDTGIGTLFYERARIFSEIPIHPKALIGVESISNIPVIRRKTKDFGAYVCHHFPALRQFLNESPYFVPIGKRVDKFVTVHRPLVEYSVREIYVLVDNGAFARELRHKEWVTLASDQDVTVGYFKSPVAEVGLLVNEDSLSPGDFFFYKKKAGFVLESKEMCRWLSTEEEFVQLFISLSKSQKARITAACERQYNYPELTQWLMAATDAIT